MKKYKNYGGLKYLIQYENKPVFKFICYEEPKSKTQKRKKIIRKTRRRRKSSTK